MVLYVHESLPGTLSGEGIVVVLNKAVDEVHGAEGVPKPFDIVLVPQAQVAGAVILHQRGDVLLLEVVLGHRGGFFELVDDMVYGLAVEASGLPGKFDHTTGGILDDLGIEAVGDGFGIGGIGDGSVIALDFVTGHAFVEIDGRRGDNVAVRVRRLARRHEATVIDDGHHLPTFVTVADGLHKAHEILL